MEYFYRIRPSIKGISSQRIDGVKITRRWVKTKTRIDLDGKEDVIEESTIPIYTGRRYSHLNDTDVLR